MYMATLSDIYHAYKTKKISYEELKSKTLETVFKEKYYYNIHMYNNDDLVDLILFFNEYLEKIIDKYDEKRSSYAVYIRNSVGLIKKAKFYRNLRKTSAENVIQNYAYEDAYISVGEAEHYYNTRSKLNLDFEDIVKTPKQKKLSIEDRIKIIILKSCYYLSDDNLYNICEDFNIPYDEMKELVETVKATLTIKSKIYTAKTQNKARVYFLQNRYKTELEKIKKGSLTYEKLKKSLEFNTKLWEKYQEKPIDNVIAPSNVTIGKALNIPYHTINIFFNDMKNCRKNDKKGLS